MSASTEKKLRAKAREEGTDKKTLQAQEEAKKQAKSRRRYTAAIIAAILFIVITLFLNSNFLVRGTTAATIGGQKISPAEMNYEYATEYYNFANNYGSYASLFGLDTSNGIQGLGTQKSTMSEDGGTWRDYFKEQAVETFKQIIGLCNYAKDNGIALDEQEMADIDQSFEGVDESAQGYGLANADKYFSYFFGKGVNTNIVRQYETRKALASKVYNQFLDEAAAADTDFVDYDMVNVRHILVKTVADDEGNYTDEAMAEAKAKAEEILAEFEAGDKTEESFAALAEQYSEDAGSNTNGGLYENVYKNEMVEEFNDWIFDSRKAGDTGIVHGNNGGYDGYHVLYFSGLGNKYSTSSARQNELAAAINDRVTEIKDAQDVSTTMFFNLVGKN